MEKYDIFLSYRDNKNIHPSGGQIAKLLYDMLTRDGYRVFFDKETPYSGDVKETLKEGVENSTFFVWIVTELCFDGIDLQQSPDENNYYLEIHHALEVVKKGPKNIIPIKTKNAPNPNIIVPYLKENNLNLVYRHFPEDFWSGFVSFYDSLKECLSFPQQVQLDVDCKIYKLGEAIECNDVKPKAIDMPKGYRKLLFVSKENPNRMEIKEIGNADNNDKPLRVELLPIWLIRESEENNGRLTFTEFGVPFDMIFVEGGTFMMGAGPEDKDAHEKERPQHEETVNSFWIGETVVTQGLWKKVMEELPEHGDTESAFVEDDNCPVVFTSFDDASVFVRKVSEKTGRKFRLPTSKEWEYAAKGGKKSKGNYLYSGGGEIDNVAWYTKKGEKGKQIQPVKQKAPNELGLYDMSGNVYEWCEDFYIPNYTDEARDNKNKKFLITRGGACDQAEKYCRVTYRSEAEPTRKGDNLGFRIVMER